MDARRRYSLVASLAAGGALLALVLWAAPGATAGSPTPPALLPDLVTLEIVQKDLQVDKRANGTQRFLELTNEVANEGVGPLEIVADPESGEDCDGDGHPRNDRVAYQRIYHDDLSGDSVGYFERDDDTAPLQSQPIGCMRRSPQSSFYWQIWNLARYRLRDPGSGETVARSRKIAYCTVDVEKAADLPGTPDSGYYPQGSCTPDGTLGISIGWADVYVRGTLGQEIDVSGVDRGRYCLTSKADPPNAVEESDDHNNVERRLIRLNPATLEVTVKGPC